MGEIMTPSKMRKEGYKAFMPNENPADHFHFKNGSYNDFCDGWDKAEEEWEKEQEELEMSPFEKIKAKIDKLQVGPEMEEALNDIVNLLVDQIEEIQTDIKDCLED